MNWQVSILGRGGVALGILMLGTLGALALIDTQKVTLESKDGRRVTRNLDIGRDGRVYLVRRLSDAPCVEHKSWGYDARKIWVDDGCRAEFEVYRPDDWSGHHTETFTLESIEGRRDFKRIDTRGGVKLVRQLSDTECVRGKTWDYDRKQVWVDDGCRAVFEVRKTAYGEEIDDGYEDDRWLYVRVESGAGRVYRRVDTGRAVSKFRQLSDRPCIFGKTWGFDRQGIWVDNGCRALFKIRKRDSD